MDRIATVEIGRQKNSTAVVSAEFATGVHFSNTIFPPTIVIKTCVDLISDDGH